LFSCYRDDLYVVTDPDIMPTDDCPNDFVEKLYRCLKRFPRIRKAGLSLKIDDIPQEAPLHDEVVKWENQFNKVKFPFSDFYVADVDTTLALYIPDSLDVSRRFLTAIRLDKPYQIRHLPWYKKREDVSKEDTFYAESRETGFWDETEGKIRVELDYSH